MNPTQEQLITALEAILKDLGVGAPHISLDHPEDLTFGDYTTNAALAYSRDLKEKPFIIAQKIVDALTAKNIPHVEKIDIAGPGFINIKLDRTFFSESLKPILSEGESYGANTSEAKRKIIIEYTNTNVLKPLHIGHLMGNVIGEALSRVIEVSGADLKRNTYQGDVGLHVARAVWGMRELESEMPKSGLSAQSAFIGKAYAYGSDRYEEDPKTAEEIKVINKQIFDESDKDVMRLYEWGRKVSLDHFETLYKKLGTKFDYYFFESEVAEDAVNIVKEFLKKGVFVESDGAIVFKGEERNEKLHTRVFINSQGLPTYEAKDIAHALRKYKKFAFDQAIIITANEQNDYFSVMLKALSEIDPHIAANITHLSHGLLRLTTGKMASRKGNVITGEALIEDMEKRALEKLADHELSQADKQVIAEKVAIAAIKYSILRQASGSDIIFDPEQTLSFEGDSGPYLQYTVVRATSVLNKAKEAGLTQKIGLVPPEASSLERVLYRFPEVVLRACKDRSPHYVIGYLTQVAALFNSWYGNTKIVDAKDPYTPYRLALADSARTVLSNGLKLMGIPVPEKM